MIHILKGVTDLVMYGGGPSVAQDGASQSYRSSKLHPGQHSLDIT